jgi:hypothetical protein
MASKVSRQEFNSYINEFYATNLTYRHSKRTFFLIHQNATTHNLFPFSPDPEPTKQLDCRGVLRHRRQKVPPACIQRHSGRKPHDRLGGALLSPQPIGGNHQVSVLSPFCFTFYQPTLLKPHPNHPFNIKHISRSKQNEDTKAPLKAIRNAIASLTYQPVEASIIAADIDALIHLYRGLADACEARLALLPPPYPSTAASGSISTISSVLTSSSAAAARSRVHPEAEAAANVRDLLRYRLSRLVTGDLWDATPNLKLKVLKIMFALMLQEKERLMVESAQQGPILRLKSGGSGGLGIATGLGGGGGSGSGSGGKVMLGRSKSANLGHTTKSSKWQESLDEVSKMPGGKMMQLVKLLLMEQQHQHNNGYGYYGEGERGHVTSEGAFSMPPQHQHRQYTTPTTPSIGLPAVETTVEGNVPPFPHLATIQQQQQQQQEPSPFNNFDQDLLGLFDDDGFDVNNNNNNNVSVGSGGLSTALSRHSSSPAPSSSSHQSNAMFATPRNSGTSGGGGSAGAIALGTPTNSRPPSSAASSSSMLTSQFNKLALSGGDRGVGGNESPFIGTAAQQQLEKQQQQFHYVQGVPTPPSNYPRQQQQHYHHQRQDSVQSSLSDTTNAHTSPPPLAACSTFHAIRRGSSGSGPVDYLTADNNKNNNNGNEDGGGGMQLYYPHQVDTSSPYFGVTHPCNDNANTFGDVAPQEIRPGTGSGIITTTTTTTTTNGTDGTHHGGVPLPTPTPMRQSHSSSYHRRHQ